MLFPFNKNVCIITGTCTEMIKIANLSENVYFGNQFHSPKIPFQYKVFKHKCLVVAGLTANTQYTG